MDNVTGFVEALQGGAAYLAIGYGTALFLMVWRYWQPRLFAEVDGKPPIIPPRIQWIPAYVIAGLSAFGAAFAAGEPAGVAATIGLVAAMTGGSVAVGGHRSVKELRGKSTNAKPTVALLFLLKPGSVLLACLLCAVAFTSTGCATGTLLSSPLLASAVDKAMAWIGLIDSVVSTLLKDPNVPPDWPAKYEALRVKFAQAALVVSNLVAEGEESHQQTLEAVSQLEAIGQEILELLRSAQVTARSADAVAVPEPRFK